MMDGSCSIEGCDRRLAWKSMCKMHYTRLLRHGDPLFTKLDGRSRTPTWKVWYGMIRRCRYESNGRPERYIGKGVRVCQRWETFENFLADMGERPEGLTLDRINNNGDYEPGNCRWATTKEQNRNRRNNRRVTINGETHCLAEWADIYGITQGLIYQRQCRGLSVEEAITRPVPERFKKQRRTA